MAARAMWKGRIRCGDIDVPVKLYSAIKSTSGVHFRLLHDRDLQPVKQQMVNPETGKVVEYEDVRRAFPTEGGDLVMLDEEDLAELEPEGSRDIEITRFVDPETITHQWYDRPYFLGPDESNDEYFALTEALRKQKKEGVARWVMRKKEYVGALRVEGDYLMLMTLRHAGEVVPASALEAPGGRALDKREVQMAKQLVEALEGDLELEAYHDEYRERVLELVEAKAEGKVLKFPTAPGKKAEDESLSKMLEQSIKATKKKASA
ncbi:MAG TPA: Ku protein [Longimicrobiales bacterium]|nr:Ku protein [Longimicrobiales bacterium]